MSDPMAADEASWLQRFHAGERATLEACYRETFEAVAAAVSNLPNDADRESVVHEVFFRLVSDGALRRRFTGGSLAAFLATVARNLGSDYLRTQRRHPSVALEDAGRAPQLAARFDEAAAARLTIEKFRREVLPKKWERVFHARFVEQRDQRDAAASLGIARTTLAYQELRIRALLKRFLLKGGAP